MKKLALLMVVLMISASIVAASPEIMEVEVDGEEVMPDDTIRLAVSRGDEVEVRVKMISYAEEELRDVQLQASILGYEHGAISDVTSAFDMKPGTTYTKKLTLTIPDDLEVFEYNEGDYKLRLIIADRDGTTVTHDFNMRFEADRHDVAIRDILLDPSGEVVAGKGLIASVRVKNNGERDEDDGVKVTVTLPALDLEDTDFIDELDSDESATSEDLFLRIPNCAEPGTYVVRAELEFNDGHDTVLEETSIKVLEDESCDFGEEDGETVKEDDKTVITVPRDQEVVVGTTGAVYPIMITNTGSKSKQYVLSVSGLESWGTSRLEGGALVVVAPKATETRYLYVTANEGAKEGAQLFVVNVQSGDEAESIALTATVKAGEAKQETPVGDWDRIKKGLEIGLIVLVVLLVILGLIVGFNKLKGNEEEEEVSGQTYY